MSFEFGGGAGRRKTAAILNSPAEPDPLSNVEYTDDMSEDARRELAALAEGFRERRQREADRFRLATDSEFWVAVCFKSREDKERFLKETGLLQLGDKYIDGYGAAKVLKVDMAD